eukprot:GHVS01091903.1.p1 GENE.GHVS01091903.1~~GHVS01091903.1.p1  ORF type:complete len:212 (+),score=58.74 GHVS01091903.1:434-1069(+)
MQVDQLCNYLNFSESPPPLSDYSFVPNHNKTTNLLSRPTATTTTATTTDMPSSTFLQGTTSTMLRNTDSLRRLLEPPAERYGRDLRTSGAGGYTPSSSSASTVELMNDLERSKVGRSVALVLCEVRGEVTAVDVLCWMSFLLLAALVSFGMAELCCKPATQFGPARRRRHPAAPPLSVVMRQPPVYSSRVHHQLPPSTAAAADGRGHSPSS